MSESHSVIMFRNVAFSPIQAPAPSQHLIWPGSDMCLYQLSSQLSRPAQLHTTRPASAAIRLRRPSQNASLLMSFFVSFVAVVRALRPAPSLTPSQLVALGRRAEVSEIPIVVKSCFIVSTGSSRSAEDAHLDIPHSAGSLQSLQSALPGVRPVGRLVRRILSKRQRKCAMRRTAGA